MDRRNFLHVLTIVGAGGTMHRLLLPLHHKVALPSFDAGKMVCTGIALDGGAATVYLAGGTNCQANLTLVLPGGAGIFKAGGVYDMKLTQE